MEETAYAADKAPSELQNLLMELSRAHDLITTLENRLSPVIHHGLKENSAQLAPGNAVKTENHISQAVSIANAVGNRLNDLTKSLAV